MDENAFQRRLIPLPMMARLLGVTVKWLQAEADAGAIPSLQAGNRTLVDRKIIEQLMLDRAAGQEASAK